MITAVIPAYNVEKTIRNVIKETKKYCDNIIVIDDGSRDNTGKVVKEEGIKLITHKKNKGLGAALRTGFNAAINCKSDIILTLDSDGQHNPNEIPRFLNAISKGYDFVLGERDLKKYPLIKKIGNFFLNVMTNIISGTTLNDTESGFRAFSSYGLKRIYPYLRANRYEIASEIIFAVGLYNIKYTNVKISSPIYVKGVTIRGGIRNFLYMLHRRKRDLKSYVQDSKYILRKWLKRFGF